MNANVQDHADLFVEHALRQAERWNIAAHEPAGHAILLEDRHVIAERRQIIADGQRGRTGTDAGNALAVLDRRRLGQQPLEVAFEVGRDALETADGYRLVLDATAATRRFTWPVAYATENAREYVRFPIQHIGVGVSTLRDQSYVFWNVRMRRAGPLTIHHAMEVVRIRRVGRFHSHLLSATDGPV